MCACKPACQQGAFNADSMDACRVLQPGNPQLSGAIPLGTPYPVLRYNGPSGYSMCSQFPCARKPPNLPALRRHLAFSHKLSVHHLFHYTLPGSF